MLKFLEFEEWDFLGRRKGKEETDNAEGAAMGPTRRCEGEFGGCVLKMGTANIRTGEEAVLGESRQREAKYYWLILRS